jgi:steroid delta-isomerase-like uncharacterized protein
MSPTLAVKHSIKALVVRQAEAINRHDPQALASIYAPRAVVSDPQYPEPLNGRDAIARDYTDFFTAFPDLRFIVTQQHADGDDYAFEFTISGTHSGPMVGPTGHIPPTNKRIDVRGSGFGSVDAEGRIANERRYYDLAGMLGQLGLTQ